MTGMADQVGHDGEIPGQAGYDGERGRMTVEETGMTVEMAGRGRA